MRVAPAAAIEIESGAEPDTGSSCGFPAHGLDFGEIVEAGNKEDPFESSETGKGLADTR
jgi:hypothetical protein